MFVPLSGANEMGGIGKPALMINELIVYELYRSMQKGRIMNARSCG